MAFRKSLSYRLGSRSAQWFEEDDGAPSAIEAMTERFNRRENHGFRLPLLNDGAEFRQVEIVQTLRGARKVGLWQFLPCGLNSV
ncbi:hypothetical protein GCM10010869_62160 [Mesorhizobium tianshanense]|nr:hypothetical protein GCM10010869_62160 [Mesorhizobium tianshanense]